MTEPAPVPHLPVAVIGGGQAGLSVSHFLRRRGLDHLVFERHRIGHAWRAERWDSFCLVTPNWQCRLPGFPYAGPEPDGFMARDEIVRYVEGFAAAVKPPIREGVDVTALGRRPDGTFTLATSEGSYTASNVVLAVSAYHRPNVPLLAERLPGEIVQVHSSRYRNPEQLPPGAVLVVGTGQSGCQIAEDLHLAGRRVHLSVGSAPRSPRRYRGKDAIRWLDEMGQYAMTVADHPKGKLVRRQANHYMTGRGGGREIDLRRFAAEGMRLYGRLAEVRGAALRFAPDLRARLDAADEVYLGIRRLIDGHIATAGIDAPEEPAYAPAWEPEVEPLALDLAEAGVTSVVWGTGFRSDWSWVDLPCFNGAGEPDHERGVTPVPGLMMVGLPWLNSWGSGRFSRIAEDAEHVVDAIVERTVPAEFARLRPAMGRR
ncbi:MSMEG_0569 family flavin-dependent oxidoreductase [Lichenibacterium dinghuense]|uniref:MSMEG_0569 family flavin-dependent oxidoreductase n=1 Tax=Lichenibacterium dinghuense TaxID=2895977 RepID=UPI001F229E61|nr:MSMEG_0569 family flavin-dependent oxidoreductase [Lichenibacterium sp. 6Y81]